MEPIERRPNLAAQRPPQLVGRSPAMRRVRRAIADYGGTEAPVLVTGETGTGKELVAHGIHHASKRACRAIVTANCAALTPSIFESELFGSRRGAFTGADRDREGLVGAAQRGTLFLDEIGELPLEVQPKLLRLLESGLYRSVGSGREQVADVRIVAATNRDLHREVERGRFRADLFYRINVFRIHLPPLRDRPEDIPNLVDAFLFRAGASARSVEARALEELLGGTWPGNARELSHVVARTLVRTPAGPIRRFELEPAPAAHRPGSEDADDVGGEGRIARSRHEFLHHQRAEILRHLNDHRWNVSAAARALGWTRGALRSRIRRPGLES